MDPLGQANLRQAVGVRGSELKKDAEVKTIVRWILVSQLLFLPACVHVDRSAIDGVDAAVPYSYAVTATGLVDRVDRWWTTFGDDDLTFLVGQALDGNLTIRQADARLRQAQAVTAKTSAQAVPSVSWASDASFTEKQEDGSTSSEHWQLGFAGSYEVDLWGRVHALSEASRRDEISSLGDRNAAGMTVAAEVVLTYCSMLSARERQDLLERQLTTAGRILESIEVRYRRSQASLLEVLQQRQAVAQLEALVPAARADEQTLRSALVILTGGAVSNETVFSFRTLPKLPPLPEAGIPADLLRLRPDIQAAAAAWESSSWSENAARADRLPALRLTAGTQVYGDHASQLFDNWLANLAAGLAGPLLDGGQRRAEVERAKAVMDEKLSAYKLVVIQAVRDVCDALVLESEQQKTMELQLKQLELAQKTYAEAMIRYGRGQESYLSALSAEISRYGLERTLVNTRYQLLAYRVKLYRSLGGDWDQIMNERPVSSPGSIDHE